MRPGCPSLALAKGTPSRQMQSQGRAWERNPSAFSLPGWLRECICVMNTKKIELGPAFLPGPISRESGKSLQQRASCVGEHGLPEDALLSSPRQRPSGRMSGISSSQGQPGLCALGSWTNKCGLLRLEGGVTHPEEGCMGWKTGGVLGSWEVRAMLCPIQWQEVAGPGWHE